MVAHEAVYSVGIDAGGPRGSGCTHLWRDGRSRASICGAGSPIQVIHYSTELLHLRIERGRDAAHLPNGRAGGRRADAGAGENVNRRGCTNALADVG